MAEKSAERSSKPKQRSTSAHAESVKSATKAPNNAKSSSPRKIPGSLPYLTASGTLKKALDRSIEASRPDRFNADYVENVLKLTGGGARATIPILKKMGFLSTDGIPTELYGKFRTDTARSAAALQGLRSAFPEIFKRSEYAHQIEDAKLKDIIVEITGLKSSDPVAVAIKSTFRVLSSYVGKDADQPSPAEDIYQPDSSLPFNTASDAGSSRSGIGLVHNINIVIPETSDLKVLNAIFRSIKENLLK